MSEQQLQQLKQELDSLKTQLGAARMRLDEAAATLETTYGIKTMQACQKEQTKLVTETIPALIQERDRYVQEAQEVLNGLSEDNNPGGHTGAQGRPVGSSQPGTAQQGRTVVGRRAHNTEA